MSEKFEVPADPELRLTALLVLLALAYLIFISRVFRDVNPG